MLNDFAVLTCAPSVNTRSHLKFIKRKMEIDDWNKTSHDRHLTVSNPEHCHQFF